MQETFITSTHAGDEMFFVIELDTVPSWEKGEPVHISNDKILNMLAEAQQASGMRVALTYKNLDGAHQATPAKNFSTALVEHQAGLEALEHGIAKAKKIEAVKPFTKEEAHAGKSMFFAQKPNHTTACIARDGDELVVINPDQLALTALDTFKNNPPALNASIQRSIIEKVREMIA